MPQIIGLSLSACVSKILCGERNLHDVLGIVAATKCDTALDYAECVSRYLCTCGEWKKNPVKAMQIAWHFWNSNKLYQPRTVGLEHPGYRKGDDIAFDDQWWIPVENFELEMGYPIPFTS